MLSSWACKIMKITLKATILFIYKNNLLKYTKLCILHCKTMVQCSILCNITNISSSNSSFVKRKQLKSPVPYHYFFAGVTIMILVQKRALPKGVLNYKTSRKKTNQNNKNDNDNLIFQLRKKLTKFSKHEIDRIKL